MNLTTIGIYLTTDWSGLTWLTHWGWVTHICVSKLTIIVSDNGLLLVQPQAIIWINAGILLIRTLGTNLCEILSEIHAFSFKKMHFKMSSAKWRPFCLGLNVLNQINGLKFAHIIVICIPLNENAYVLKYFTEVRFSASNWLVIIGSHGALIPIDTKPLPEPLTISTNYATLSHNPDCKVHGANMGPTWVLLAPDGPHVGPMNLAIREASIS